MKTSKTKDIEFVPGYDDLFYILMEAYERAALGKGHQRHSGGGEPFNQQWILRGSRMFGSGSLNYQIGKKNEEIMQLETTDAKIGELLDVIVYSSALIILLREQNNKKQGVVK
jgi:hypothetical protein